MDYDRPNLLILTSSFPRGPSDETCGYIRDFARSLSGEFNVQVLAPPDASAAEWPLDTFKLVRSRPLLGALEPFQGSCDLNDMSSRNPFAKLVLMFSLLSLSLKALMLARKADVICSHWMVPCGLIGSLLARVLRKPHIVVEHSGGLHLLSRVRGGRWLSRFIVGAAQKVVVVSSDLRCKLMALSPEAGHKIEVIPMGTSIGYRTAKGPGNDGDGQTILFVGRLAKIKGVEVLLRAAQGEDWRLLIAGRGERRRHLEDLAELLKIDARFIGQVDSAQRQRLLTLAQVVVIPSIVLPDGRTEGMPVACLEALAAGLPVIASRVGGLPEIITDGENGLLVEPGDPDMLRETLKLVLSDRSLQQHLRLNARRTALRFDWVQVGMRFAELIKGSLRNDQDIDGRRLRARSAEG
ncbi:MAG TPA: glycosyltransferase family 4 protein [Blastocatellia bacterium]|jgi:glycosyltransferase involved in cell wall biosynthesis|nr:glycosyltransferase family 4 protein [Blastocatellia bacterium]